jgi:GntR family transcriptional regulator
MPDRLAAGTPVATPLYKEVKRRVMRGLARGEWHPGDALPSETRLAERFAVSIGTLRKAVDELVAEKILVRQQGRGTFVTIHTEDRTLFHFFHIVGKDGTRENPVHEMVAFERSRADADAALALDLSRGERVYVIRNVLRLQGRPVLLDVITIPASRFPDLDEATITGRDTTIYGFYQARYGINVIRIVEHLSATLADAATARRLGIRRGAPLLGIRRIAYTYHDTPVELRVSLVDTSRHDYLSAQMKSDG